MELLCRPMEAREAAEVSALLARVFRRCVASRCGTRGRQSFLFFVQPEEIRRRLANHHRLLVAVEDRVIVGVIEVRDGSHICLLFVDLPWHRRGVARQLVRAAFPREGEPARITVNASPNSVAAYLALGFRSTGPQQMKNGILFTPMVRGA